MTEQQSISINLSFLQKGFREALMFSIFESLEAGVSMLISNNETLKDLKEKFDTSGLKNANIHMLENGPINWTISIKKDEEKSKTGCCGVCGGH